MEHSFSGSKTWSEVDGKGFAGSPVGRGLQNGGSAETAVRYQHFFAESRTANALRCNVEGDTGKVSPAFFGSAENDRNQRRARLDYVQPKLPGELVREPARAHLGDGKSAGRDHQGGSPEFSGGRNHAKLTCSVFRGNVAGIEPKVDLAALALGQEHVKDLTRGMVAEELAKRFFVPLDLIAGYQIKKVPGLIPR